MNELSYLCIESEAGYIEKFCELYSSPIQTPDGFYVICKNPKECAKHVCGGGSKVFQKARASKIDWINYILLNPNERKVLLDKQSGNLVFFFEKGKTAYAVICAILGENKLNIISGFIVAGKRKLKYRNGKPPFEFYQIKKAVDILNNF